MTKEAIIFVPGFDAECQNYYLDTFLEPGLLTQLEDINIQVDPEEVKIPGLMGKRFLCQLESGEKTMDIYEVYWNDVIDRLSTKEIRQKFSRGFAMIVYWFSNGWRIMKVSPVFFIQSSIILILVLLWYFGIVVLVISALEDQTKLSSIPFLQDYLNAVIYWSTDGLGWQIWLVISTMLTLLPISINLIIDFLDFFSTYLKNESSQKKPPVRALIRKRIKQTVNNVISEESYGQITILSHSLGCLMSTDFMADYHDKEGRKFRFITWGSALESSSSTADWMKSEIKKCLDNPHVECWHDFYSNQDWFCSKVSVPGNQPEPKLVSQKASFNVSFFKQLGGESHLAYFFDPKVLRHLVMGHCSRG